MVGVAKDAEDHDGSKPLEGGISILFKREPSRTCLIEETRSHREDVDISLLLHWYKRRLWFLLEKSKDPELTD